MTTATPQHTAGRKHSRRVIHHPVHHHSKPHPLILLSTSSAGLDFIFRHEAQAGVSNHLHWPGGSSGVTLGPGYDMKDRSSADIIKDMMAIGLNAETARKVSAGAGKIGSDADDFATDNKGVVNLSHQQELSLLKVIIPKYENIVKRNIFIGQKQYEFDALVSFCYNPGGSFLPISRDLNQGKVANAMSIIGRRIFTGGHRSKGLAKRRHDEINLYEHGIYDPNAPAPKASPPGSGQPAPIVMRMP